jgi:transcriptional regulator with XRE-family HTH domain
MHGQAMSRVVAGARCTGDYDQIVTGGAVIDRILRRSGISACELARRLGVAKGQVAAWVHGDPPLSVVDAVARACSTDLAGARGARTGPARYRAAGDNPGDDR